MDVEAQVQIGTQNFEFLQGVSAGEKLPGLSVPADGAVQGFRSLRVMGNESHDGIDKNGFGRTQDSGHLTVFIGTGINVQDVTVGLAGDQV